MSTLQEKYQALMAATDEMYIHGIVKKHESVSAEQLFNYWQSASVSINDITLADCRSYVLGNMQQAVVKDAQATAKDPYNK